MLKKLAFTGHRPSKLAGYKPEDNKELLWRLQKEIVRFIEEENVSVFISGAALGIDTWAALIVIKLKEKYPHIKLWSAIPCTGHPNKWKEADRITWGNIIAQSDGIYLISPEPYKPYLMQKRNEWMTDQADYILGVWDGSEGGTGNCIKYAKKSSKNVTIINPNDLHNRNQTN